MPIGGAEDRMQDRVILRRFVELCGGPGARIRVLSAASGDPQAVARARASVTPGLAEGGQAGPEPGHQVLKKSVARIEALYANPTVGWRGYPATLRR